MENDAWKIRDEIAPFFHHLSLLSQSTKSMSLSSFRIYNFQLRFLFALYNIRKRLTRHEKRNMKFSRYLIQLNLKTWSDMTLFHFLISTKLRFNSLPPPAGFLANPLKAILQMGEHGALVWTLRITHSICCWCYNSSWKGNEFMRLSLCHAFSNRKDCERFH